MSSVADRHQSIVVLIPGTPFPLGATPRDDGTNFAVASGVADGMVLCLFDRSGALRPRSRCLSCDAGVWHGFVPGVGPGQAYGYRATGPYDPAAGGALQPGQVAS